MAKHYERRNKHEAFFNDSERAALEPVLTRLGKGLGEFSKEALRDLLCLHYNLPQEQRGDIKKVLAGLQLAGQTLGTIRRHEIGFHARDPEFGKAIGHMVNGDPDADTYEAVKGLRGLLDDILLFSERGY